jgi:hypothetical protein
MATEIFVFGSNEAGRHGKGSAAEALRKHGAKWGVAEGHYGNSYAIPTKDKNLKVLSLTEIRMYVLRFMNFAYANPDMTFNVVSIGCGLAGYKPEQIAPMFRGHPKNVRLTKEFDEVLQK